MWKLLFLFVNSCYISIVQRKTFPQRPLPSVKKKVLVVWNSSCCLRCPDGYFPFCDGSEEVECVRRGWGGQGLALPNGPSERSKHAAGGSTSKGLAAYTEIQCAERKAVSGGRAALIQKEERLHSSCVAWLCTCHPPANASRIHCSSASRGSRRVHHAPLRAPRFNRRCFTQIPSWRP